MRARRTLLAAALLLAAAPLRADEGPPRPVSPGQEFGGKVLKVRAPGSEGWVVRESAVQILFGHPGASRVETYVAMVSFHDLPDAEGQEAFTDFIRKEIAADTSPERFADYHETFAYTEERGYACVRYTASSTDVKAEGGPLKLAISGLYCRHPMLEKRGFSAIYSQRARAIDADFAVQAEAFLAGVRVPTKKK